MDSTINIRKIAEMAGCSASTVSRVLSGRVGSIKISPETQAKIRKICAELDYQPSIHAARLFSKRSRVIGFLTACDFMVEDDNLSKSFFHLCAALSKKGYRCLPLLNSPDFLRNQEYLNIFKRGEIDALIVWGAGEGDRPFLQALQDARAPFLLVTNQVKPFPSVFSDQEAAVRNLVQSCWKSGARRFAGIFSENGFCHLSRKQGFESAVQKLGADARIWKIQASADDFLRKSYRMAPKVLAWKPDVVVCCNDAAAVGIETCCLEREIAIPEQLRLIGGDNIKLSEYAAIPLTTFDQMAPACAEAAAKMMSARLEHQTPLSDLMIPADIITRRSCPLPR